MDATNAQTASAPPAPEAAGRARSLTDLWEQDHASQWLGMALLEVGAGHSRVSMRVTPQMANGHGICHGGLIFALADSAFAFASNSRGGSVVAAGAVVDFLSPARVGEELEAVASERHLAGRNGIYDVTVRESRSQRRVAEFRGRSRKIAEARPLTPGPG